MLISGCSSSTAPSSTTPATSAAATTTQATTTDDETTTSISIADDRTDEEETPRTDLLTFANGAVVLATEGITGNSDALALSLIDGSDEVATLVTAADPSVTVVIGLPAATTFAVFAVPPSTPSSGATLFRSLMIEGSNEGPDGPWRMLAETELTPARVEMTPETSLPVSWIRVSLAEGLSAGETSYEFGEIVGYGNQEPVLFEERFTGTWEIRQFDRLDSPGRPLTLSQSGTVISGCLGNMVVTGTVDGAVARALATEPGVGRSRALLLVPDDNDELIVALTNDSNRIQAARGLVSSATASCSAPPPEPPSCGDTVHILFDVDSAEIRRDSERVLDDLFAGLGSATASTITIIGHTSTEGDEAYNQDLSERRAAAIVEALVERGFDAGVITSAGRGETEPLVTPELDEAARSLNRRVEVSCAP